MIVKWEGGVTVEWKRLQEVEEIEEDERGLMIWIGDKRIQDCVPEDEIAKYADVLKEKFGCKRN